MASKILLVDDDEVVLRVFEIKLEAEGFGVVTSISAQDGFDLLADTIRRGQPFDLLVTDLDMPGNRGTVLIRAVRELEDSEDVDPSDRLPILLLTGENLSTIPEHERDELMTLGVSYLSKQDAADRLISTVRHILSR